MSPDDRAMLRSCHSLPILRDPDNHTYSTRKSHGHCLNHHQANSGHPSVYGLVLYNKPQGDFGIAVP